MLKFNTTPLIQFNYIFLRAVFMRIVFSDAGERVQTIDLTVKNHEVS
jgi:hypothetical protein